MCINVCSRESEPVSCVQDACTHRTYLGTYSDGTVFAQGVGREWKGLFMQRGSGSVCDGTRCLSSIRASQIYVRSTEVGDLDRDLDFFNFSRMGLIGRVDA